MYKYINKSGNKYGLGVQKRRARARRSACTVADLWEVELGEVPPLQPVGGVGNIAGDRGLAITDGGT